GAQAFLAALIFDARGDGAFGAERGVILVGSVARGAGGHGSSGSIRMIGAKPGTLARITIRPPAACSLTEKSQSDHFAGQIIDVLFVAFLANAQSYNRDDFLGLHAVNNAIALSSGSDAAIARQIFQQRF